MPRVRIVELSDHALQRGGATVSLWREAATALGGQADIAVAVLTRPLRTMFTRLGLELVELVPALIPRASITSVSAGFGVSGIVAILDAPIEARKQTR